MINSHVLSPINFRGLSKYFFPVYIFCNIPHNFILIFIILIFFLILFHFYLYLIMNIYFLRLFIYNNSCLKIHIFTFLVPPIQNRRIFKFNLKNSCLKNNKRKFHYQLQPLNPEGFSIRLISKEN